MALEALIARYGLLTLFVGAAIEGETVAIVGGLLAHQHLVSFAGAAAAVICGSFVADQLLFAMGRQFRDHPRVRKIAARPGFAKALATFERHPRSFIFAFRFLYGMRTASPIAIGTSNVAARIFILINAAAAIVWGLLFVGIGYVFGHGIEQMFGRLRSAEHGMIAVAVVGFVTLGLARLLRAPLLARLGSK